MKTATRQPPPARRAVAHDPAGRTKEPPLEQIASFIGFFIYLLVFKSFFLPLFIIPTGSMAETLRGAHAGFTCPNCGYEYAVGFIQDQRGRWEQVNLQCPNCRWRIPGDGRPPTSLQPTAGDRIVVHGWPVEVANWLGDAGDRLDLKRWDVVVFKNPKEPDVNYIKRLIGLPGDHIQIIDGDIYVNDRPTTKPPRAQESLWFPYYDHDYAPKEPSHAGTFLPRWISVAAESGWSDLSRRTVRFDGDGGPGELMFVTDAHDDSQPGEVCAVYGYNSYRNLPETEIVNDVRLSCDVDFAAAADPDGSAYVELRTTRYFEGFAARLHANGELTLIRRPLAERAEDRQSWLSRVEAALADDPQQATLIVDLLRRSEAGWAEPLTAKFALPDGPVRFALYVADQRVGVEVGGRKVPLAACETLDLPPIAMRLLGAVDPSPRYRFGDPVERLYVDKRSPRLEIAASGGPITLSHLLIERDVSYVTTELHADRQSARLEPLVRAILKTDEYGRVVTARGGGYSMEGTAAAHAVQQPIVLSDSEYFVLGDNSPVSEDGRRWSHVGPHLTEALAKGDYQLGTVPADQMIGPAFFVYWPGFLPLWEGGPNLLPDFGRIRWIH